MKPASPTAVSRRRVLVGLGGGILAAGFVVVGCGRKASNDRSDIAGSPLPPASAPILAVTLAELIAAIDQPDRAQSFAALTSLLDRGASHDDLFVALAVAHDAVDSPAEETEVFTAMWRLERAISPSRRLEMLLHLAARHRRALRAYKRAGPVAKPDVKLRAYDKEGLQRYLDEHFAAGDHAGVSAALRVTMEEDGNEAISDALARIACADDGQGGLGTAAAIAGLRLLEARNYREAGRLLDRMTRWLPGGPAARPEAWKAIMDRARALPETFERGAPDDADRERIRALAATATGAELSDAVHDALLKAASSLTLWDGLGLGAHDRLRADAAGGAEPDGRSLRMVHALRLLGERAPAPAMRAACLLSAAERLGRPTRAGAVDASENATATAATTLKPDTAAPDTAAPALWPEAQPAVAAKPKPKPSPMALIDALRLRLVEIDARPAAPTLIAVARIEAISMLAPEATDDVLAALALPPASSPAAPERAANLEFVAKLRANAAGAKAASDNSAP